MKSIGRFGFAIVLWSIGALALGTDAAIPADKRVKGAFIIASTPYCEDWAVDYDALVAEAKYMDAAGCAGVIWPQSNDSIDLLTPKEKHEGVRRLVGVAKGFRNAMLLIGISGTNTAEMLELAAVAEKIVGVVSAPIAFAARPPMDGKTEAEVHEYYEALGNVARIDKLALLPTSGAKRSQDAWIVSRELLSSQERLRDLVFIEATAAHRGADRGDFGAVCRAVEACVGEMKKSL